MQRKIAENCLDVIPVTAGSRESPDPEPSNVEPGFRGTTMGQRLQAMTAHIRFANLLAPVLGEVDDAGIALAAARILNDRGLYDIDVMPVSTKPVLTDDTIYALLGNPVAWHAVRLLMAQGKLPADARVSVRIFLSGEQWRRAGMIARMAEIAHDTDIAVERPRRGAFAPPLSPRDLVRYL
jgi:hypothetical protein